MNELFLREKDLQRLTLNCMLSLRQSGTSDAEAIKAEVLSAAERALDEPQPAHHSGLADTAASFRTLFDQHRAELHAPGAREEMLVRIGNLVDELRDQS